MTNALTVILLIGLLAMMAYLIIRQNRRMFFADLVAALGVRDEEIKSFGTDIQEVVSAADKLLQHKHYTSAETLSIAIVSVNNALYGSAINTFIQTLDSNSISPETRSKLYPLLSEWRRVMEGQAADKETITKLKESLAEFSAENRNIFHHNGKRVSLLSLFKVIWDRVFAKHEVEIEATASRLGEELSTKLKDQSPFINSHYELMTPREFEVFIARLFEAMGYRVELTPPSRDYGVDIIAWKDTDTIAVQVKKYSHGNNVGSADIQKLLGAMSFKRYRANKGVIVTTSDFTVHALEQADQNPVELWGRGVLDELITKYLSPPAAH